MINVAKTDLPTLKEYNLYLRKIWKSRWLTNNGVLFQEFQMKLKNYLKVKYILPVSNGTLALQVAIKALDLKGEIITTPFTFAATTTSIIWENCTPIFADIDPVTFNINPLDVEKKITKKTSAILAVHVYGNPCAVEELEKIAKKHHIKIIYDAAHTFGVEYKNQSVLNYGDISTLSFHATKTFHTIEGGAIVTNSEKLYDKLKLLINFGIESEESVVLPGINAKMNEFQAAMGLCNLNKINDRIKKRKNIYTTYLSKLNKKYISFQNVSATKFNYTYMPVAFSSKNIRDDIFTKLLNNDIKARKYFYPLTNSFKFVNSDDNIKSETTIAKKVSDSILCLPIYSSLSFSTVAKIIKIVNSSFQFNT